MTFFLAFEDQMPIQTTPLDSNSSLPRCNHKLMLAHHFHYVSKKGYSKQLFYNYQTWIEQVKDLNLLENRDV